MSSEKHVHRFQKAFGSHLWADDSRLLNKTWRWIKLRKARQMTWRMVPWRQTYLKSRPAASLRFEFLGAFFANFSKAVPNCQRIAKEMGSLLGFELIWKCIRLRRFYIQVLGGNSFPFWIVAGEDPCSCDTDKCLKRSDPGTPTDNKSWVKPWNASLGQRFLPSTMPSCMASLGIGFVHPNSWQIHSQSIHAESCAPKKWVQYQCCEFGWPDPWEVRTLVVLA